MSSDAKYHKPHRKSGSAGHQHPLPEHLMRTLAHPSTAASSARGL